MLEHHLILTTVYTRLALFIYGCVILAPTEAVEEVSTLVLRFAEENHLVQFQQQKLRSASVRNSYLVNLLIHLTRK